MDWALLGQQAFYGLTNGVAYVLFALGLTIVFGLLGVINLAHGEVYMLGAMVFAFLVVHFELNYFLAGAATLVMGLVLSVVINQVVIRPVLGRRNFELAAFLATLGLSMLLVNLAAVTMGTEPLIVHSPFARLFEVGGVKITGDRVVLCLVGGVVVVLTYLFIVRTPMGRMLRAATQDTVGARLVGINLVTVYAVGFALASVLGVLTGIVMAPIWFASSHMGQLMLLKGFVICVVAGLGSIRGAIIVGLLLGLVEAIFGQYVSMGYREGFGYIAMIIVLLVRPQGLLAES